MHRRRLVAAIALTLIVGASSLAGAGATPAATPAVGATGETAALPPGFVDELVGNIPSPTAVTSTPDGRLLVTSQGGQLWVVQNGTLVGTPALNLTNVTCNQSERGMLGVAVDPNFAVNHRIYIFYTREGPGANPCPTSNPTRPANRVSRFTLGDDNVVSPGGEKVLVDGMPSYGGNHNGGDIHFGHDGFLYISVGDGGCDYAADSGCAANNDAARDQHILAGKILRVTAKGGIPATNPYQTATDDRCNVTGRTVAGHRCQETFAWGLRNPFRMAFDDNAAGTVFHVNDVGQYDWEEVDLGASAADYGWNVREGHCVNGSTTNCGAPPAGMTNPLFDYHHATGCYAITDGAFVPNGLWPPAYNGVYLYADFGCNTIFRMIPAPAGGFKRKAFAATASSPVGMHFGPDGAGTSLYYTAYAGGGQLRVIRYAPPVA